MTKNLNNYWKSLNRPADVSQRELVLGLAVCALTGLVLGMAFSPRKTVTIGSNNHSESTKTVALDPGAAQEEA